MKTHNYDIKKFHFREIISKILETDKLEKLHEIKNYEIFSREKDQYSDWHKKYYNNFNQFNKIYLKFNWL